MKKTIIISFLLAIGIMSSAQHIQRTTGDTLVIDSNNRLVTTPLRDDDYGMWRKIWLNGDRVHWQTVTQTTWRVFAYGVSVNKGKKYEYRVCVTVVDSNGVSIPDAVVTFVDAKKYGKEPLTYDAGEMAYVSTVKSKSKIPTTLSVVYQGISRQVSVNPHENYYYSDFNSLPYQYRKSSINENPSWMVTDKNMYRPGDTIKWKVVGVNPQSGIKKGSPLSGDSVAVFLFAGQKKYTLFSGRFNNRGVVFGESLVDTLKLIADRYYSIRSFYYYKDKPAMNLAQTGFSFKDYELKDVVAKCKSDKAVYLWGDSVHISFNVTDEKGDYLDNGIVRCHLNISNIDRIYNESLWYQDRLTDTLSAPVRRGVAEIVVPTSKWLNADFSVYGEWSFRSADGMERSGSIFFSFRRDSLPIEQAEPYKFLNVSGFTTFNTADSVGFSAVAPFDSVASKPRPFHWVIYRNAKFFASGVDTVLDWKRAEKGNALYYCFISGDGINNATNNIRHGKYGLNVEVAQRNSVVPGSFDEITVRVTDNKGKPVQGVDVTALGYTKKLNRYLSAPDIWDWRKKSCERYVSSFDGSDFENSGDSVLEEPWLVNLLQANSTQYWQLTHNDTDTVRFVRSRSGVNKPQVVPVLVREDKILPVSRLDIDLEPAWVTGTTNERYVFVLRPGRSHQFDFYVGDTVYTSIINGINVRNGEKVWLSIPVSSCTKSNRYNDNLTMQRDIENRRVSVSVNPVNGVAYINVQGNDSLVRRISSYRTTEIMNKNIGYQNFYGEMRLDGPAAEFPFFFSGHKIDFYSADRMMIVQNKCSDDRSKKLSKKEIRSIKIDSSLPNLDDSICTLAELKNDWISQVDNRRSSEGLGNGQRFNRNNTYIYFLYVDGEEYPVNVMYQAVDDSVKLIYGAYNYSIPVSPEKRCKLTFLYKNARVRTLFVDVKNDGRHIVKATLDSSMTVVHDGMTIALEDSLRHEYEKTMSHPVRFSPDNYAMENGYDDGIHEEVMAVAYGTGAHKSKPMMMKAVAAPQSNFANVRGVDSYDSTAEEMDESVSYAVALDDAAPVPAADEEIIIRDDFSDVAFWQPDLVTDRNGEVHFSVKYPDDLTEWREAFVAIKGRQRGYAMSNVIARKDEVAKLKMPRFAVVGDSVSAIGTGVNYITGASAVDTIYAVAEGDSLCMQYVFGHDGEKRCSPVFAQGMEARDANFYIIESDTSFTLKYNKTISLPMEVNVYTDIREALINSVKELAKSDWCGSNDYLALRLSAMRMVADTDYTKEIDKIEKKLLDNRMADGLWCWYGKCDNDRPSLWITERVLSAFPEPASLNSPALSSTLGSLFIRYRNNKDWSQMFEVAKIFNLLGDTVQRNIRLKEIPADSLAKYDRSALIEYQMMSGADVKFDTMRHRTYTEGEYYTLNPKRSRRWFNPVYEQIETSLMAYRYYSERGDAARCRTIKLWLMQYVRNRGRFGISLSESLALNIVKTLWNEEKVGLKDLLYQLSINDKSAYELPYSTEVTDDARLEYKGKRTLYVSTEQKYWDEDPDVVSNGMTIKSEYVTVKENRSVIKVDVTLEADAEYLVISIPIPAGCSYDETTYSYTSGESHREEYKDRVNIFCERIGKGTHHFEVPLNERYPGAYTINPSEVHLIYFPAFNANNKKTKVRL